MQRCWSFQPSERPDAKTIINELAYLEHSPIPPEKPCVIDEEAYRKLFRILLESEREYVFTLQRLQVGSFRLINPLLLTILITEIRKVPTRILYMNQKRLLWSETYCIASKVF